jgi:shikimate kinase
MRRGVLVTNIIFVGLMGAGKTTVGRTLAKNLKKTFLDTDLEIEKRTGVKIPVIFEMEGEQGFRKRESTVLDELSQRDNVVLATGGGAVLDEHNRALMKQRGLVVYLRADIHDLYMRTRNDKNRPLLQTADPQQKLRQLFEIRDPLYQQVADIVVDTGNQPVANIVNKIQKLIAKLLSQKETDTSL